MAGTITEILLRNLDNNIPNKEITEKLLRPPSKGWLMAVRQATKMKQRDIAGRMDIRQQAYSALEDREELKTISLASLAKAADALDCELVYFLVPKPAIADSFAKLAQLHDPHRRHLQATEHSMALEGQAVDKPDGAAS